MQKRIIPAILAAALLVSGMLSILSINNLQGNARVINYAGVVRGATQRLIKQELNGQANDPLIAQLDGILSELSTGEGPNELSLLPDLRFQSLITQMQREWAIIREEIARVRQGAAKAPLYERSETYFELADQMVSAAEAYTEQQVQEARSRVLLLNAIFLLLAGLSAWFSPLQVKRQRDLQAAEDANRTRSERLSRMSEDLRAPLNDISELTYVADLETYELLFLNEASQRSFGLDNVIGKKCYQMLQGKDSPCEFCTNSILVPGETYTWEFTNPITKRHYLLKDRLIEWEGRSARLEIAFDITAAEAEKQALKTTLETQTTLMECVRILYQERDLDQSVPLVLERLGRFLCADRSYLFFVRDQRLYNDYEWCAEGILPQRELLQNLSMSYIDRWLPAFEQQSCVILEDVETLQQKSPEEYAILRQQKISSLVTAPLVNDGQLWGFVGVDNPPPSQIHSLASMLQTLGYFLMLTCRRTENERQLSQLSYFDTLTSFYNRNRYIKDSETLSSRTGAIGVVYLDVNGLKDVNDRRGHAFGDRVLVECAQQMREIFQDSDFYRIGGDEFVILSPGVAQQDFELRVAALRQRFRDNPLCSAAIGARWDAEFKNIHQIIAGADAAMYEDKKVFYRNNPASNRYRHYSDELLHLTDPPSPPALRQGLS